MVEGRQVTIHVGLDCYFPLSLPLVYLYPPDALGPLPHVDHTGYVCYAQAEGLLINRHDPLGLLEDALTRVATIRFQGMRGENYADFVNEFDAYWRQLDNPLHLRCYLDPTNVLRESLLHSRVAH